jgi:DnaJ-class molecular chaperone
MKALSDIIAEGKREKRNNPISIHVSRKCPKCNGTGIILEYGYYRHGKCFECNGKGII